MELINRESKEVRQYRKTAPLSILIIRDTRVLYFTHGARNEFGLIADKYAHFFEEDGRWYFFQNREPTGFPFYTQPQRPSSGLYVFSAALIGLIMQKSPAQVAGGYKIKRTDRLYEKAPIFEILFNEKPIKRR
jgi:hypothetical protein